MEVSDGPVLPSPSSLAATTPDPLNMNTPDFTLTPSSTTLSHVPQSSAAKPAKKRKSWGQALPEPKTSLPPRKRAKTADEKEQRRIERIKRNRAAAHNSRERKRQEAERLEYENVELLRQIQSLQRQLAYTNAINAKCKDLLPDGLPQISSEELASINLATEESLVSTPSSFDTIDPRASLAPGSTPGDLTVKDEPISPSAQMPPPPAPVNHNLSLDQTQHSAAMLWDLQCQSSESSLSRWSQIILWLMHLNIMTCYKSIMIVSWTLWPTRMATMLAQLTTSTASSASTITKPTTPRRIRRRRPTTMTMTATTTISPLTLISTTLFSLMVSLSPPRRPAWATLAQSILATGPRREAISARQSALPSGETEMHELRKVCQRIMVEHQKAAKTSSSSSSLSEVGYRRLGSSRDSMGNSSSEERKDEGRVG